MKIPKIIYQTFPSKLPDELQKNVDQIKKINSDWNHILCDDGQILQFVTDFCGEKNIKRINLKYFIVISDLFRYIMLYENGGVYLDIKSTTKIPLSSVIKNNDSFLLSYWNNKKKYPNWGNYPEIKAYQQWFIISEPKHPFLLAVIQQVLQNIKSYNLAKNGFGKLGVERLSGPVVYTKVISQMLKQHNYRFISTEQEGLEYSCFDRNQYHKIFFENHYSTLTEPICL